MKLYKIIAIFFICILNFFLKINALNFNLQVIPSNSKFLDLRGPFSQLSFFRLPIGNLELGRSNLGPNNINFNTIELNDKCCSALINIIGLQNESTYNINLSGDYVFQNNIIFDPLASPNDSVIIHIKNSNTSIDFNDRIITQGNSKFNIKAICIEPNLSNITIKNGSIKNIGGQGIVIAQGCKNICIKNMRIESAVKGGIIALGTSNNPIDSLLLSNVSTSYNTGDPVGFVNSNKYDAIGSKFTYVNNLTIAYSSFNNNKTVISEKNSTGLWIENCKNVNLLNIAANNNSSIAETAGVFLQYCNQINIDSSLFLYNSNSGATAYTSGVKINYCNDVSFKNSDISNNYGNGVIGIDLVSSGSVDLFNLKLSNNFSTGEFLTVATALDAELFGEISLYTRTSPLSNWVYSGDKIDLSVAYLDYKAAILKSNSERNFQDWNGLMNSMHAINYTLDYYSYLSKAYGIRCFDSSDIEIKNLEILNTKAAKNSAFGIYIDGGYSNKVYNSLIENTLSFSDNLPLNSVNYLAIEKLFGPISTEVSLFNGETLSMLGRSVGLELSNFSHGNFIENNIFKNNKSSATFSAGLFLNRAKTSLITANIFEENIGIDLGFGALDSIVNTTNILSRSIFYNNGTEEDRNINYGFFWSDGGTIPLKYCYISDLNLAAELSSYDNLEIKFNKDSMLSLNSTSSTPDIKSIYIK